MKVDCDFSNLDDSLSHKMRRNQNQDEFDKKDEFISFNIMNFLQIIRFSINIIDNKKENTVRVFIRINVCTYHHEIINYNSYFSQFYSISKNNIVQKKVTMKLLNYLNYNYILKILEMSEFFILNALQVLI